MMPDDFSMRLGPPAETARSPWTTEPAAREMAIHVAAPIDFWSPHPRSSSSSAIGGSSRSAKSHSSRRSHSGLVRLSVPTTYGHYRVLPMIKYFTERYPRVSLEVNIANANVDFVAERYDLAVRMGILSDSSLIARKLEDAAFAVFASPSYLKQHGHPQHPSELGRHTCVTCIRPSTGRTLPWLFRERDGSRFEIVHEGKLRCSGDPLGCATLARHGAGLAQTYRCIVEEDVRLGRLVKVLEPYAAPGAPFSLLHPVARVQPPAVRLFADLLVEHCSKRCGQ